MGVRDDRANRLPVESDTVLGSFAWRQGGIGSDSIRYKRGGKVRVEIGGKKVDVPFNEVRWLAEVLLQVTDLDPEYYASDAHDDYNRPNLPHGDRR